MKSVGTTPARERPIARLMKAIRKCILFICILSSFEFSLSIFLLKNYIKSPIAKNPKKI